MTTSGFPPRTSSTGQKQIEQEQIVTFDPNKKKYPFHQKKYVNINDKKSNNVKKESIDIIILFFIYLI